MTENLLAELTLRRLDLSEALTAIAYDSTEQVKDHNRAIGMIEIIDDLLNYHFIENPTKEEKEEE